MRRWNDREATPRSASKAGVVFEVYDREQQARPHVARVGVEIDQPHRHAARPEDRLELALEPVDIYGETGHARTVLHAVTA